MSVPVTLDSAEDIVSRVVDGRRRTVTIHRRDVEPLVIPDDGELDGGEVVPGFRLPISEIFA